MAVDDTRGDLIVSSRHFGDEDAVRVEVVLSRALDPHVARYLYGFGIRSATDKVVIPARPELGLKARCCYPLRHRRKLYGFLWLIDDAHSGTDELIRRYADTIAAELSQRASASDDKNAQLTALGRQLLSSSAADSRDAAAELSRRGFISPGGTIQVVAAAQPLHQPRSPAFPPLLTTPAVREWSRAGRAAIELDLAPAAVLLCSGGIGPDTGVDTLVARLADALDDQSVCVGCSAPGTLDAAPILLRDAVLAACAGHIFSDVGRAVTGASLSPYQLLMDMAVTCPQAAVPPAELAPLFDPANRILLETAEAYLDVGGDRTATADALYIHRSTLYYRVSQIEKLTGIDLADGRHRLALHLAVKLHKIADSDLPALLQSVENLDQSS
ncbi:PucR family transcriptional regulator [Nocardia sp. NPDC004278]